MASQHGLIVSRQMHASGVTSTDLRRLLKAGALVPVRHGVYVDAELWHASDPYTQQPILRIRAAHLTLRSEQYVFSHDSAALLLGMGAPRPTASLVHVTRHKVHGDAVRAGVKHHRAPYTETEVVEVDGLLCLRGPRTALDMAREHGRVAGLAAADAALRLGSDRGDLAGVLAGMRSWPHSRVMRWCVDMADGGAESYLESQGRDLVLELGIGRPETQFGLTDGHRTVYCDLRVGRHVFEIDGVLKYKEGRSGEPAQEVLMREKRRQDFITGFKLGMSRITADDCGPGRRSATRRLLREFADTERRFGQAITDLAPYVVQRHHPNAG